MYGAAPTGVQDKKSLRYRRATARVAPTEAEQEVRRERADVGIDPYENIASTAMECVRRKEHPCTTRLARACVSGQRMVAQRRYEGKTVGLSVWCAR